MLTLPRPDIHSHDHTRHASAIINISPGEQIAPDRFYSVAIHPWDAHSATTADIDALDSIARHPQVIIIGETGLDALRGDIDAQMRLLKHHIALSESLHKPLLLHVVKQFQEIIALRKLTKPSQPWIIHGFRGKPQLANELIAHGFYISLGEKFNQESAAIIPSDRLLFESDTSPLSINEIIARINNSRLQ